MQLILFTLLLAAAAATNEQTTTSTTTDQPRHNKSRAHRFLLTPDGPIPRETPKPRPHSTSDKPRPLPTSTTPAGDVVIIPTNGATHNTVQEEIDYLKEKYEEVREDVDEWMSTPFHRTVVLPALIGVLSGMTVIFLYFLVKNCCQMCKKRCCRTRTRLGHVCRDLKGDRKNLLKRRNSTDDEL